MIGELLSDLSFLYALLVALATLAPRAVMHLVFPRSLLRAR